MVSLESIVHEYVNRQKRLLQLELTSEQDEENQHIISEKKSRSNTAVSKDNEQRSGWILRNLQVDCFAIGLLGRSVVHLVPMNDQPRVEGEIGTDTGTNTTRSNHAEKSKSDQKLLPAHRLTVGDEIEIVTKKQAFSATNGSASSSGNQGRQGGVITEVTDISIAIALFEEKNGRFNGNHDGNAVRKSSSSGSDNTSKSSKARKHADNGGGSSIEDESDLANAGPLTIVPRSSVEVHKKLIQALEKLRSSIDDPKIGLIIQAAFRSKDFSDFNADSKEYVNAQLNPNNTSLDTSQIDAIRFALYGNRPISLIHGPPGTGKTSSVAELILQAVHVHKMRVLVTAPSNVAVDNVLERVLSQQIQNSAPTKEERRNHKNKAKGTREMMKVVRIGHPARIQPAIIKFSLEYLVQNADGTEIVSDIRSEMKSYLKIASNPKTRSTDRRSAYREIRTLRKEIRQREGKVLQDVVSNAQVVFATNVGAASSILNKFEESFDLVIIDEAAQALEASCWIPILKGKRVVLAGDHCQLPPTIKSRHSEVQKELSKTLFERLMKQGEQVSRMLKIQYRMHEMISNWASRSMYEGRLISHDSVKARKISHLPYISTDFNDENDTMSLLSTTRNATMLLIDTAGCEMFESTNAAGSKFNHSEADIVSKHVRNLVSIGMKPEDIAVITPYNGQVETLRGLLLDEFSKLEIRSVDGFQGGEREIVILSLVRSSDRGGKDGIGFLSDKRRLNVAVTRAKRQVTVICDSDTVSQNKFLSNLVEWIETNGDYVSAMEYVEEDVVVTERSLPGLLSQSEPSDWLKSKEYDQVEEEAVAAAEGGSFEINKEKIEIEKEELDERLSFFAEIAEVGEELLVETFSIDAIRKHLDHLSSKLGLQYKVVGDNVNLLSLAFLKADHSPSVTLEGAEGNTASDIRNSLTKFVEESNEGDVFEIRVNQESELKALIEACNKLQLSYDAKQNDSYIIRHKSYRSNTDKNEHKVDNQTKDFVDEDNNQKMKEFSEIKNSKAVMEVAYVKKSNEKEKREELTHEINTPKMNTVLGNLALERAARLKGGANNRKMEKHAKKQKATKKKKASGSKPKKVKDDSVADDELDDLAFLDAQIEKVQTSHGRKVEATGATYKTIVNGILISKPQKREKPRNSLAAGTLKNKIKQAQQGRKVKTKKKNRT